MTKRYDSPQWPTRRRKRHHRRRTPLPWTTGTSELHQQITRDLVRLMERRRSTEAELR